MLPILQIIFNGVIRGAEVCLIAIGVTMIFSTLRFANFAHGEFALVGAYLALLFSTQLHFNFIFAALLAAAITGLIGVASHTLIFRRLRDSGALVLMVAAMGLSIAMKDVVRGIWGSNPRAYDVTLIKSVNIFGAWITYIQLWIIAVASVAMLLFHLLLHRTRLGVAMRATSDNHNLAQASGINTDRVVVWVWFICTAFAGIGGILVALESQLWPEMGFEILLPVFAAAILGGIGNPYGAMLGALILGLSENFGIYLNFAPVVNLGGLLHLTDSLQVPTGYKPAISFVILIVILLFRPEGIFRGHRGT